ncbi:MAG: DEAD/DEAH box helicase [Fimbriimonadaceae bacterium]|nr:DEAD/DEAH box helicase [Fimbriimonadaceae bacterium]
MRYREIELDAFQVAAIEAIERHDTVIVAAPTGAGKTVIAEYAIERYLATGRRIIYTAPVKALSNQKFRDFSAAWVDQIGIVTGDVSINPTAPVLIMTTEIFRNTVFDDPARLHDVEYVILDEIHYINDIQRGTVWEESLIFAPPHIGFICLSATIPNLDEFADWIREIRPQLNTAVVVEQHRPVPLEHHLWVPGAGEATLKDVRRLSDSAASKGRRLRPHEAKRVLGAGQRDPSGTGDIVAHLEHLNRLPCLYFCFSRAACEQNARRYAEHELLSEAEQARMLELFDTLSQQFGLAEDAAAARLRPLVGQGTAFHHAGMLPMLKEVVERLFATGLLKLLFTTETFAVGVNMPAATVVFESLEKYDGVDTRYLLTREYQQMAGRAGRRGIDEVGYIYARIDPAQAVPEEIERIVTGAVEPTESQFNLSYASILSLWQRYGENVFSVVEMSFANFQNSTRLRELEADLADLKAEPQPAIDCLKNEPKSIRRYLASQEELRRAKNRADGERRRVERRCSGRKQQRQLAHELRLIEDPIQRLEEKVRGSLCHTCQRKKTCSQQQRAINTHYEQIDDGERQILRIRHHHRDQIAKRLAVLREFGYLDEQGLTAKGDMAASLYGFELPITELFYAGFFENMSEQEIAALMVAVVFESKRTTWYAAIDNAELKMYLREAALVIREIERREVELGIEGGLESLDESLTTTTLAWMDGVALDELTAVTDASGGDVVRTLRHAVDLLRQFRRSLDQHPLLRDKIDLCIRLLRRDEVDAERQLRLGHAIDRAADVARTAAPLVEPS